MYPVPQFLSRGIRIESSCGREHGTIWELSYNLTIRNIFNKIYLMSVKLFKPTTGKVILALAIWLILWLISSYITTAAFSCDAISLTPLQGAPCVGKTWVAIASVLQYDTLILPFVSYILACFFFLKNSKK